ncbi:MAG: prolyl oligopeptidase family serine peptidase [Myxococcales bacterium]|nr:prolyl oligopeptidase family serine peptidase [Myxococcales bacterium]
MSRGVRWSPLGAVALLCCRPAGDPSPAPASTEAGPYRPFLERKAAHLTTLREDGPSPGRYDEGFVPEGATVVRYRSGEHELLAWLFLPATAEAGPVPGLLYCHGSFSLGPKDAEALRPLVDAGLAVLAPALRGENGNPGRLELLYGEVDDAIAAAQWLAARPEVDAEHLYAVGHSIGGGVVAMLALHPEAPVRLTASVGGIYVPQTFQRWSRSEANAGLVRFDPFDPAEGTLRTLGPNLRDLAHPHHAYIGDEDTWFHPNAAAVEADARRFGVPFTLERVPGDHMSCLAPALERFVARIEADLE